MKQSHLFQKTRWQLSVGYAGVLAVILALCGFGVYEAIAHAHRITIEQELNSVAQALKVSLESHLGQPGHLNPSAVQLLPDACWNGQSCFTTLPSSERSSLAQPEFPTHFHHHSYTIALFNPVGQMVVIAGNTDESVPLAVTSTRWKTLVDDRGQRYRQISLALMTPTGQPWGRLQLVRSLADFDRYVTDIGWLILLGLPGIVGIVILSGWWLAGRAMQPIYHSYQQIQQFTADAAHELRTPLAAIRATIESMLLLPTLTEADARESLRIVGRQNHRLSSIVSDLLVLCRIDQQLLQQGSSPSQTEAVVLNPLIKQLLEEFVALALAAELTLAAPEIPAHPIAVMGNPQQLYRLMTNLVMNAIQYTPPGGTVTIQLKEEGQWAIFLVHDTGIGIPPAEQHRIFDRFYRVDSSRTSAKGAGLGLAIVQGIVQTHQGMIQVISHPGQGSTFGVKLPKIQPTI